MNEAQLATLRVLNSVLQDGAANGMFDRLTDYVGADVINSFAEAVTEAMEEIDLDAASKYKDACEAMGWRYFAHNPTLADWCGDSFGIAHAPTVEGVVNFSDSVYGTWRQCWLENVATDAELMEDKHAGGDDQPGEGRCLLCGAERINQRSA